MRPLRRSEPRVFFPWEKRRGLFGAIGRTRARMVALLALGLDVLVAIHRREEKAAAVRATRATLTTAGWAISSYRADHGGACPTAMSDLVVGGYVREDPVDAWGRSLRLLCPGRRDPLGFDLSSDGPDGIPEGLDRLE